MRPALGADAVLTTRVLRIFIGTIEPHAHRLGRGYASAETVLWISYPHAPRHVSRFLAVSHDHGVPIGDLPGLTSGAALA